MLMFRIGRESHVWSRYPWEKSVRKAFEAMRTDGVTASDCYDALIDQYLAKYAESESELYRDEMLRRADHFCREKLRHNGELKRAFAC